MKPIARVVAGIAVILGIAFLICVSIGCAISEKHKAHYFFIGIADFIRIILLFGAPIWILGFVFGVGN